MECKCLILRLNSELYKEGKLNSNQLISGASTKGYEWEWATCLCCGKQHMENIKRLENVK